ncbi:unnamed protein product, partial [marine sediment metagenome]
MRSAAKFRTLIDFHADVKGIPAFALGKHQRSVKPAERCALQQQIVNFMAKTMAGYGRKFKGDRAA